MTISGIYRIICKVNNKQYIGSACNIQIRKQNHFSYLKRNKHHSILLQRAYNKYGKDNFYFEILAYCPKEYLIKLEQWFLDNMKPEYNIQKIAGSNLGYKHTEATKKKLSLKRMGIKPSKDSIEKQRQKMLKFKQMCTIEEAINHCISFGEMQFNVSFDKDDVSQHFNENLDPAFEGEMSIGRVKYIAMDYFEDRLEEDIDEFEDELHNYYSQLK